MTRQMAVADLLCLESVDARPHRHGGPDLCHCAASVVAGILDTGLCPSCGGKCRLPELIAAYDRGGGFASPVHLNGDELRNGHHRLAVAVLRGAAVLDVTDDSIEDRRVRTVAEAEWLRPDITYLAKDLRSCKDAGERAELLRYYLGISLSYSADPGTRHVLAIVGDVVGCPIQQIADGG